ncbi:MAG: UbiX family flavin prenyltransferase [Trueperaceae bacterium]
MTKRIVVGISGASGAIYGIRALEVLRDLGVETHLVLSAGARATIAYETRYRVDEVKELASVVHGEQNMGASISSGSFHTDGMLVAPCSMKTLSGIANSYADNLLIRAADVVLKERRTLVLMVRETPLHAGHLRLMSEASANGAVILPPMPAFYHQPQTVDDIINQGVGKALDQFGIDAGLFRRWAGGNKAGGNKAAREVESERDGEGEGEGE